MPPIPGYLSDSDFKYFRMYGDVLFKQKLIRKNTNYHISNFIMQQAIKGMKEQEEQKVLVSC